MFLEGTVITFADKSLLTITMGIFFWGALHAIQRWQPALHAMVPSSGNHCMYLMSSGISRRFLIHVPVNEVSRASRANTSGILV